MLPLLLTAFSVLLLFLSFVLGAVNLSRETLSSYECGFEPLSVNHIPFCIKFFLLGILFLVFDVEVALVFPSVYTTSLALSFIFVLLLGLCFEFCYGALSWVV